MTNFYKDLCGRVKLTDTGLTAAKQLQEVANG